MAISSSTYQEQLAQEIKNIPDEYLANLIQIVRIFRDSITLKSAEDSFRQGWREAMTGSTHPARELWDGINAE